MMMNDVKIHRIGANKYVQSVILYKTNKCIKCICNYNKRYTFSSCHVLRRLSCFLFRVTKKTLSFFYLSAFGPFTLALELMGIYPAVLEGSADRKSRDLAEVEEPRAQEGRLYSYEP